LSSFEIEEVRDIDAVWADLCELFLGLYRHQEAYSPPLVSDWQRRWRTYLSNGQERLILLGRVEGSAAGMMNTRIQRSSGVYDEMFGFVEDAYVDPAHRGSGLAQAMLQRTEAWCYGKAVDYLRLSVHAQNELGRHFWDKSGFEPMLEIVSKTLTGAQS
jgi:ribosomal protein S18 acetylase RimI-like enzyme